MFYKQKAALSKFFAITLLLILSVPSHAGLIDLSTWERDGSGSWVLPGGDNNSVLQTLNSRPTVFFNDMNSQGLSLSGSIEVEESGGDDDFFGFVLGYDNDDLFGSNATTNYILVDWKQGTQGGWDAGMSISRVTGSIDAGGTDTNADAWDHIGNVSFIERAATLGAIGWADATEYQFDISFTATNITVLVDGIEQFNINGAFEDGSFGFYNFSQPQVRYAGIEEDVIPPQCGQAGQPPCAVPEPSTIAILGLALVAFASRRFKRRV
ncbi:MAG: PEP-CTERM sorting domain-containing protein [Cognaticolwellia sp.]